MSGNYFVGDSVLGEDMIFYIDPQYNDSLYVNDDGYLVNNSQNTIYLYSPSHPDVTISASRFSTFKYRATNYDTTELQLSFDNSSSVRPIEGASFSTNNLLLVLVIVACISAFLCMIGALRKGCS